MHNLAGYTRPGEATVVLLHGLAGHHGEWLPIIDLLNPSVGVVAPDLRGHGASFDAAAAPDFSREAFVADIVALIEANAAGPVTLVGQSMGSIVATLAAAARLDLVAGLVLVEGGMEAMDEAGFASLQRWFATWPDRFADAAAAAAFFGTDAPSTPAWVAGLQRTPGGLAPRFDATQMLDVMRCLATEDRWTYWQAVSAPTTIVRAADSMIADADIERMLAVRPDAELVVVDDSGHDVHLDQPAAVATILSAMIKR